MHPSPGRVLVEAIVSPHSSLVGMKVEDVDFGDLFKASVIAIHSAGSSLKSDHEGWAQAVIKPGDTLLMVCKRSLLEENKYFSSRLFC